MAPATKGGMHFLERGEVGLFSHGRKPGCEGFFIKGSLLSIKRRPPRQRSGTIYLPRAEALNPSGRCQPVPDRTLGAQGLRPGGAINPRGEAASTFGNTGKHRPDSDPDRIKKAPQRSASAFDFIH